MIIAHIPVEESVLQLVPAGAALMTAIVIVGRTTLDRLRRRDRRRSTDERQSPQRMVARPREGRRPA
jgi:hypothetical protein